MKRITKWLAALSPRTKRVGVAIGAFLCAVTLAEIGLRIEYYCRRGELGETEFRLSPSESLAVRSDIPGLGYVFRPGMAWGPAPYRSKTNSCGYFDYEHPVKKPEGVARIVIIGDSVAEELAAGWRESFGHILERKLNESSRETKWEVIVLARSGYATSQELVILRLEALAYEPDLILWSYVLNDPENPFYHAEYVGTVALRQPWCLLLHRADLALFFAKEKIRARGGPAEYHQMLHNIYWDQIAANVAEIRRISGDHHVPIVFLIHPWFQGEQLIDDYRSLSLHHRLADLASQNGLVTVDLLDAYRGHPPSEILLPNDPCHLNVEGHRITGEFLFDTLRERLSERVLVQTDVDKGR